MLKISFNEQKDSYEICCNGFSWVNDGRESFVSVRKKDGKKHKNLLFKSAKSKKTEYSQTVCNKAPKIAVDKYTLLCYYIMYRTMKGMH